MKRLARTAKLVVPHWAKKLAFNALKKLKRKKKAKKLKKVTIAEIRRDLKNLGVKKGDTLLTQTALSAIGFVDGGPNSLVDAFLETIGTKGTLLIPTFNRPPNGISDKSFHYDARNTETNVGRVAEVFRKRAGVIRSLHPTHSVAAKGSRAGYFAAGHEYSDTGFGKNTPYDKLVKQGGKILLIGNNNNSLVHYIELQAGYPLTHKAGSLKVKVTDERGKQKTVSLKLHTMGERLVIVEDSSPKDRDYVLCQDYLLIPFPGRKKEIQSLGFLKSNSRFLERRQKRLEKSGALKFGKVGDAPACLIDVKPFYKALHADFRENVSRNRKEYEEMASKSNDWNEIQWYYLVFAKDAALSMLKLFRRLFKIR